MNIDNIKQLDSTYYMNTFGQRVDLCFSHGKGVLLYDSHGREYYDFMGGIAVNSFGHGHPVLTQAIVNQAEKMLHNSNLYYIENQALAAEKLCQHSVADKVFFANSGAEANEGAFKLALNYHYRKGNLNKNHFITMKDSFHGRTLATTAATGQDKYHKPYAPFMGGFKYAPINDSQALSQLANDDTCAIVVEIIQGESGVHPLTDGYMEHIKNLCAKYDILLIVDEVQTGMARTGSMFAYEHTCLVPDIFTTAKALGGGVPVSAVCARAQAATFQPGDHGTTFGGNPLATAAVLAAFQIIEQENLCKNASVVGEYLKESLKNLTCPHIKEVRGKGLMLGVEVEGIDAAKVREALLSEGVLVGNVGNTIRILPPLNISKTHADMFCEKFQGVISCIL